ncbi:MAG: hypothetical protein UU73_C0003G0267 [Candidatus Daviesbacteria bacterium GW2011_GWA1_41_61]|nr:MAG: membrane protein [Candidatus Daviesbacteria bacterium GW2011_GWC1_40_9]KKR93383.1 MAG: hypothetical protein UU44_C0002G0044 [Candidatus Daviesbacteria bacterium GW2011_GWB1_41_15]KKS15068.1 MAG: hypothetical protein UU73_C0003G0267 [Candidatus Daviesbacteria bacterium GW2011_GWA1_41_61]
MPLLLGNLSWMSLNIFLALMGLFFSFFLNTKNSLFKAILFILWFLFIPNTIYLLTDIQYFPEQFFRLEFISQIMLIIQYALLLSVGIITYYLGFYNFEKFIKKSGLKFLAFFTLIIFNYLIAFGVVLGKLERIHSWFVFTSPQKVIASSLSLLNFETLFLVLFFGSAFNVLYFLLKRRFNVR